MCLYLGLCHNITEMNVGEGIGRCPEEEGFMLAMCVLIYICTLSQTYSAEVVVLDKEVAIFKMYARISELSNTIT